MNARDIKKEIQIEINRWASTNQPITEVFIREKAEMIFTNLAKRNDLTGIGKEGIIKAICHDLLGYGPLQSLMDDPEITEIMANGPYKIYIEKGGKKILSKAQFEDQAHLRYVIEKMIMPTGRRVDESSPYADFAMSDGTRVNVIIPPLAVGGAILTIRKFLHNIGTINDLVKLGTVDDRIAEFLVACVKARINILFSGATGSGKTTTMSVLSSYISDDERVVTIEDALELDLQQEHIVRLLTKNANIEGKGEIGLRNIFRNTLRMRPGRIILGEIRGEEAVDFLQALNSGHRGCFGVLHASSPADVIGRLETLFLYAGLSLPNLAIREQIGSGIDLILQHDQYPDGSRKINYVTEVFKTKDGAGLTDIFRYQVQTLDDEGKLHGAFRFIQKPSFMHRFEEYGIHINQAIFNA
jgi:pilus assembly protein CpaF